MRKFFEIGSDDDELILLIPNDQADCFKKAVDITLKEKNREGIGQHLSCKGTFKDKP